MSAGPVEQLNALSLSQGGLPQSAILKWAGGKSSLAKFILPIIGQQPYHRYIEPFAGGAAIFFRLAPPLAILGDSNPHLMKLYAAIKSSPQSVSTELRKIEHSAAGLSGEAFSNFYYGMRHKFPMRNRLENAALFLFLNRHCWNGLYRENASGHFNVPIGSHDSLKNLPSLDELVTASAALRNASLQHGDFEAILSFARVGDFVYLDPPFIPLSTTARFTAYRGVDFSWQDQVRLKKCLYDLDSAGVRFLLSNSYSKGLLSFYEGFHHKVVAVSRSINSVASKRTGFEELLISNSEFNS